MLKAYLHNKVSRRLVRLEDVVTSAVFGALEASGQEGLDLAKRFLALARSQREANPGRELHAKKITYEFWPWLTSPLASAEPDVLITLENEDSRSLIAIEAKLDSGKSSFASDDERIGDQLAREWIALVETATRRGISHCSLIYLTADFAPPADIDESLAELTKKHLEIARTAEILWLSWRDLPALITPNHGIGLRDLRAFLLEEHLGYFSGFQLPNHLPEPWVFADERSAIWKWPSLIPTTKPFRFACAPLFSWPPPVVPSRVWRFQP